MWIVHTTWTSTPSTPAAERLCRAARVVAQTVQQYGWRPYLHPTSEELPEVREPNGWGALAARTLGEGRGTFLRTKNGEGGAMLTFFECDERRRPGTMTAELWIPGEDPDAARWGEILAKVTAACESTEAVALRREDLSGWEPGVRRFAPGRYTYLTPRSFHHPRMERLGFEKSACEGGTLYSVPAATPTPASRMLEWSRL